MNARETFEALLAGEKIQALGLDGKPIEGWFCFLNDEGEVVDKCGRPPEKNLLNIGPRELFVEANPFFPGTFRWAFEEFQQGKEVSHPNIDFAWKGASMYDDEMEDLTSADVRATDWYVV